MTAVLRGIVIGLVLCASCMVECRAEDSSTRVQDVWKDVASDPGAAWTSEEISRWEYADLMARARDQEGFQPLFSNDLSNATMGEPRWQVNDGILSPGRSDIWTRERYGDFILKLEFKCMEKTNSGVFLRCDDIEEWLHTAIEVQILQPEAENARHGCGAIFDCLAPKSRAVKTPGEWNAYTVMARGRRIVVLLNDREIIDMNLDEWTEAGRNPDGSPNKFKHAYKDMAREGHIGLQYHGDPVWFRNLRIKTL